MAMFKRKKRVSAPKPRAGEQERRRERTRRALAIAGTLAILGGIVAGATLGLPRLEHALAIRAHGYPPRVVIDWPGSKSTETWLPASVRDELLTLAYQQIDAVPEPFSSQSLRAVGDALGQTGWFDRINAVRREPQGVVHVSADWRAPAAVVRRDTIDYLVGRTGEILPIAYQAGESAQRAIIGARLDPPKAARRILPGRPWPGADVRAGLDLLRLIETRPWRDQVVAVDVSDYLAQRRLVLISKWNGRTIWGCGPADSHPGEVATEVKLRRLDTLVREFGQVDAKRRIVEIAGPILLVDDTATANAQ